MAEENQEQTTGGGDAPKEERASATDDVRAAQSTDAGETLAHEVAPNVDSQAGNAAGTEAGKRGRRAEKVGIVASDKMEKTIVVRVDRLIKHPKYRRYVRRTSKFMAHDETGATIGDKVRIVETRPLSARKRWRVVEIVQKAEK
ncbi:MAG: small subunit ribosomal protein [Pyrinomonadaceae bacterium]|jgi:small subunit ribosomal protein S17|nr:small subunit ribosomal protein [Pyrinomonadaceae bacterium]